MKVFGCLVYALDNHKGRDKFVERGRPCVFVGYPNSQKGYRVFDLETHKIYTSRDVKFVEDTFPFSETENLNSEKELRTTMSVHDGADE